MATNDEPVPVTVDTFERAESDTYFRQTVARSGLGVLTHLRTPPSVAEQDVVRMNRDTLYSSGVFDLDASDVVVTLPDSGDRFMSLLPISQDHYTTGCVYGPGPHTFTRESVGTRYASLVVRTFVNADDPRDVEAVHALQDAVGVEARGVGTFEVPDWDQVSLRTVRDTLIRVAPALQGGQGASFGTREEVDPIRHLLVTAGGWGGNPARDAHYVSVFPDRNDGETVYRLTVRDVPVDGFWSISVYDSDGYFRKNDEDVYAVNGVTAVRGPDGAVTVQFGGTDGTAANRGPIMPGWNYVVRLYRPRAEILDGTWAFPTAETVTA